MNWQRTARWIVAAIGIGAAIAMVVYSRRRPAPPAPPQALQELDPNANLQGGAGESHRLRAGRSPITIKHQAIRTYPDGRSYFEDVVVEGIEESRFKVEAKVLEVGASLEGSDNPQTLYMSGGVKLTTDDGLELTTDRATWDGKTSLLNMPRPVAFKKGRLAGTGVGALYDREADAFTLLADAKAHVDVDKEGHGGADLSSSRMTLVRGQHTVQLLDKAKIVGETQTLTSRDATMSFAEDESVVKYLELRGAARVAANPGSTSNRPTMNADNITMAFYEDGVTLKHATLTGQGVLNLTGASARSVKASLIDLDLAPDGQTLTNLRATDRVVVTLAPTPTTPGRTITSNTLAATGDDKKGLTAARFEGSPRFEETPPAAPRRGAPPSGQANKPLRVGTSVVLVLTLGGQLDAIERAEFQQNAEFHDGDTKGVADIAQYNEATGTLLLLPNDKGSPKPSFVATPDMTVDATTIDVNTDTNDLKARGTVTTRSKTAPGAKPGALFDGNAPIIGSADSLVFTKSSGKAVYTGTPRAQARLKQGESEVNGDRIEYSDTTRNLNAAGTVNSIWFLDSATDGAASKQPKRQRVQADTMAYDESKRIAVYKGDPVRVETQDGDVEGRTVTFRLAEASRTLETMRSETGVFAKLSGGYEAVGHVLVYDAKTDMYTIEGLPGFGETGTAKVKSPKTDAPTANPMCNLSVGMRLQLDRRKNEGVIPGDGLAPRDMTEISCSVSIRKSK